MTGAAKRTLDPDVLAPLKSVVSNQEFSHICQSGIDNLDELKRQLETYCKTADGSVDLKLLFHSLKGVSQTIGALELAESTARAEKESSKGSVAREEGKSILVLIERAQTALADLAQDNS